MNPRAGSLPRHVVALALALGAVLPPAVGATAVFPSGAGTALVRSPARAGLIGVIVEPSRLGSTSGMKPVYSFVLSAKRTVDMTMYELTDPTMVRDLIADHRRRVKVRVILDTKRERSRNESSFDALEAAGVPVVWADTEFDATHQKTITVDDHESLIASFNLTDEYYPTTRDFGVWDTDPSDVSAITVVFNADFSHRSVSPSNGADLVWSPGSQAQMLAVIEEAKHTLSIENEEMGDAAITNAIVAAAERGVHVKIIMTNSREYDSDWSDIVRAGGHVHLYADVTSDLYIHAKTTIADAGSSTRRMYVGSINFSNDSMNYNRELGIITSDESIINDINAVVSKDYANCSAVTHCENYT